MKCWQFLPLVAILSPSAIAAPPPPPPQYIDGARQTLTISTGEDTAPFAALFADDVTVFENGKLVATGKDASLKLLVSSLQDKSRRVIGYSEGFRDLMVIDDFDTVDRSKVPPGVLVDPWRAARSVLYQFGADRLIHFVRLSTVRSIWQTPRN